MSGLVFYVSVKYYHCTNIIHSLIIPSTNIEHLLCAKHFSSLLESINEQKRKTPALLELIV